MQSESVAPSAFNELKSTDNKTVMFYNVENLFDTKDDPKSNDDDFTPEGYKGWTKHYFNEKLKNLSSVIAGVDSDLPVIVGLAEVENKEVVEKLAQQKNIKSAHYQVIHENSLDERGIDVALMYNPSYVRYIDHQIIRFDLREGFGEDYTRDILYMKAQLIDNQIIHVFVNHWPSRREGKKKSEPKRIKAAEALREKVEELFEKDANANILIMGDFNDTPENHSLTRYLKAKNSIEQTTDLQNLFYQHAQEKKGTINYQNRWYQFDQIIVSTNLMDSNNKISVLPSSAQNFNERWIMYKSSKGIYKPNKSYSGKRYHAGYSDHLPITVKFSSNAQ